LVIDTVVCLTLAKWETVSGQFGGYLNFKPAIKELNFKKSLNLREVDDVEFKVAGLAYRYDDASVDGLRSLSSRLCKCC
jgi:hypothetical protein